MAEDESTNWDYDSEGSEDAQKPQTGGFITWTASEFINHEQGAGWFIMLALATAALATGIYFLTKDYFAAGIIIVTGLVVGIFAHRAPRQLNYQLSSHGLKIENKLYPISLFKSFSIIQEGPISSIELIPLRRFMPPVSAYFESAQRDKIVKALENYLPFEERGLDTIDRISRRLRF